MNNTIYDVTVPISFNSSRRHNVISGYTINTPLTGSYHSYYHYKGKYIDDTDDYNYYYVNYNATFDESTTATVSRNKVRNNSNITSNFINSDKVIAEVRKKVRIVTNRINLPSPYYNEDNNKAYKSVNYVDNVSFPVYTASNCSCHAQYSESKIAFEPYFLKTGHVNITNQEFNCASTLHKEAAEQYSWRSATIYYRKSGTSNFSSSPATSVSGEWSNVTVRSAAQLTSGSYDIYIVAVADDGTTGRTSTATFSTQDGTAIATCQAPVGTIESGNITFIWSHNTEYGERQHAFDLQYREENETSWKSLVSHSVSEQNNFTTRIKDTGIIHWRVRTYNQSDVAGAWSESSFVNDLPADDPKGLICGGTGRPLIIWAATGQAAYQIMAYALDGNLVYDSGTIYSSQNNHFINNYFEQQILKVRLRICNAAGNWSDWIEGNYNATDSEPGDFEVTTNGKGAAITITSGSYTAAYLLRNNKPIAKFDSSRKLEDVHAVGETKYSVLFVDANGGRSFVTKYINVTWKDQSVVLPDNTIYPVCLMLGDRGKVETTSNRDIKNYEFFGDPSPSHYAGSITRKSVTVTFFDKDDVADSLLGSVVYYANNFKLAGWYMVTQFSKTDQYQMIDSDNANSVSITMERTNYDDSIEYEI